MSAKAKLGTNLPQLGQEWPGFAGSSLSDIGMGADGKFHALVVLAISTEDLDHKGQVKWAKAKGGELAGKREIRLIQANTPDILPTSGWCHLKETNGASHAWSCYFEFGSVGYVIRSSEGAAVAVRSFPLESFDPFEGLTRNATKSATDLREAAIALQKACDAADTAIARAVA